MSQSDMLGSVIQRIFEESLRMTPKESYLFFTDSTSRWGDEPEELQKRRTFLHEFYEKFLGFKERFPRALYDKYESTGRHGAEPRENIWKLAFGSYIYEELLNRDYIWKLIQEVEFTDEEWETIHHLIETHKEDIVDCIIAFPWYSTTHTRFRKLLIRAGCRYVSMPMLTTKIINGPMKANWNEVAKISGNLHAILLDTASLHMTCPKGSNLYLAVGKPEHIHQDTGLFHKPGASGNLPAGEVYMVPKLRSTHGVVVFTSAPDKPTIEPTSLIVDHGEVVDFKTETAYATLLLKKFERDFNLRHIAEFGIGTNPHAHDVSSMIEGEKILGTVHVALGDDQSMGGDTEATEHWDHIIVQPTLVAEMRNGTSRTLIKEGKLLI